MFSSAASVGIEINTEERGKIMCGCNRAEGHICGWHLEKMHQEIAAYLTFSAYLAGRGDQ